MKNRTALRDVLARVDASTAEFGELCRAVSVIRHLEARTRDAMVCRGEQLSAALLAAAILGNKYPPILAALTTFRREQTEKVLGATLPAS